MTMLENLLLLRKIGDFTPNRRCLFTTWNYCHKNEDFPLALFYFEEARFRYRTINAPITDISIGQNQGWVYIKMKQYEKAHQNFLLAFETCNALGVRSTYRDSVVSHLILSMYFLKVMKRWEIWYEILECVAK